MASRPVLVSALPYGPSVITTRGCVCDDNEAIHSWLQENTGPGRRAVLSHHARRTNLPDDRVRYICSVDGRIHLSTGDREGMWAPHEVREHSRGR